MHSFFLGVQIQAASTCTSAICVYLYLWDAAGLAKQPWDGAKLMTGNRRQVPRSSNRSLKAKQSKAIHSNFNFNSNSNSNSNSKLQSASPTHINDDHDDDDRCWLALFMTWLCLAALFNCNYKSKYSYGYSHSHSHSHSLLTGCQLNNCRSSLRNTHSVSF